MSESESEESGRRSALHAVWSFVLALVIIVASLVLAIYEFIHRDQVPQENVERPLPVVEVVPVVLRDIAPELSSEGVVMSRREVRLAAEVGGRVTWVSPELVGGGKIAEGDELVRLDDADLVAAEARAAAALADAKLLLEQEGAKGEQARREWAKLGRGEPSDLTLRKPQIEGAAARVASAEAELAKAKRDVSRAVIRSPFAGRVRESMVEVGAVLMPGAVVADLYSDTDLEVRLPFPLRDFGFIDAASTPAFELTARVGAGERSWPAELVRVDGEIDRSTLSGHVIAKVLAGKPDATYPPVGLFVRTVIKGRKIEDVCEIPRSVLRGMDEVWVVRAGRLAKVRVQEILTGRETVVVRGPFEPEDRLLLTRLSTLVEDMEVRVAGEEAK